MKRKRLLSIICAGLMIFASCFCLAGCVKREKPTQGLEYRLTEEGDSYSVVGYGEVKQKKIVIPSTYNGLPVTKIENLKGKFSFLKGEVVKDSPGAILEELVVPDSVTWMGEDAFTSCINLRKVHLGKNVQYLGGFSGCESLEKVNIPKSVESVHSWAFLFCDKLKYKIKGNCKYLGDFWNPYRLLAGVTSTDLEEVKINPRCKVIAGVAFENCEQLTKISLPKRLEHISPYAFERTPNLQEIRLPERITEIKEKTFMGCGVREIFIPKRVTMIACGQFGGGYMNIQKITFEDTSAWYIGTQEDYEKGQGEVIDVTDPTANVEYFFRWNMLLYKL